MKTILLFLIPTIFFSCSKKDDGPVRVQDIRGTKWISEETVFSGIGTQAYVYLTFLSGGSQTSGDGIYSLYDKTSGSQTHVSPMTWSLSGTTITISFTDQNSVQKTQTGAWDTGTLYIEGSYDKSN